MKGVIKFISSIVILGSISFFSLSLVYAEDTPTEAPAETTSEDVSSEETPTETPEEPQNAGKAPGEEWSGEISEPEKSNSTQLIVSEQTVTTTPPASSQKSTGSTRKSSSVQTTPKPATKAETTEAAQNNTENTAKEATKDATDDTVDIESTNTIFVPATNTSNTYEKRMQKITILSLVSTAVAFVTGAGIYFAIKEHRSKPTKIASAQQTIKPQKSQKKHIRRVRRAKPAKDSNPLLLPHSH